jgi:hypothetical protein
MAARTGIAYDDETTNYLIRAIGTTHGPSSVHPRDIFALIIDMGKYEGAPPSPRNG